MHVVFDLAGDQIAMLKADLTGLALQMHVGPSAVVEFVAPLKARIGRGLRSGSGGE